MCLYERRNDLSSMFSVPTCRDGVKNQDETDVDCGGSGSCPRCLDSKKCKLPSDCLNGVCSSGICQGMSVCVLV